MLQKRKLTYPSHDNWTKEIDHELICDKCGRTGEIGTFKECVDFVKKDKWWSKAIRTEDGKYLWNHICYRCRKKSKNYPKG